MGQFHIGEKLPQQPAALQQGAACRLGRSIPRQNSLPPQSSARGYCRPAAQRTAGLRPAAGRIRSARSTRSAGPLPVPDSRRNRSNRGNRNPKHDTYRNDRAEYSHLYIPAPAQRWGWTPRPTAPIHAPAHAQTPFFPSPSRRSRRSHRQAGAFWQTAPQTVLFPPPNGW